MTARIPNWGRRLIWITLFGGLSVPASAQKLGRIQDSLEVVEIRARKRVHASALAARWLYFSPGAKMDTVDKAQLDRYGLETMDALIGDQYPVFVNRYGVNGLASLSIRGASAAQTQVYWNGIPIQNPAHGQADLSTMAVELMDEVRLLYGGGGALWGSGQVGGGLSLATDLALVDSGGIHSLGCRIGVGSFGQKQGSVTWKASKNGLGFSLGLRQSQARNEFSYTHPETGKETMDNAHSLTRSLVAQVGGRWKKMEVQTSLWWQFSQRQIPPATFELYSAKEQDDASIRWSLNLDRSLSMGRLYFTGGVSLDQGRFEDSSISLYTGIQAQQLYAEGGWEHAWGKGQRLRVFVPLQFAWAQTADEQTQSFQRSQALGMALSWPFTDIRWTAAASARLASFDDQWLILPSASLQFQPHGWGKLRMNLQRSYRVPSLFELHIQPGGNPFLRPEQGWSLDLGVDLYQRWPKGIQINHSSTVFSRWIEDWIYWMGGSIWTPHNLNAVWSRGWETESSIQGESGPFRWELGCRTAYILATQGPSSMPGFELEGNQIPYSPRYRAQALGRLEWKGWALQYTHGYTGYRFTNLDESQYLQPYALAHLRMDFRWRGERHEWGWQAQVLNLGNRRHEIVAYRPMPGRHFVTGFSWNGIWRR